MQETAADFVTNNPLAHGYTILGLAAATFEPGAVANLQADQVTGMWPGPDLPLRVVDLRRSIAGSTAQDRMLQMVRGAVGQRRRQHELRGRLRARGMHGRRRSQTDARPVDPARARQRPGGPVPARLGGRQHLPGPPDRHPGGPAAAAFNARRAARRCPATVANLTNTIVVENTTASDPADGPVAPLCLTATSKRGGHISAVGNDIKSFSAPGVFRDLAAGGTSSAAPQVAGAAAAVWALAPSLTPPQLAGLLQHDRATGHDHQR